MTSEKSLRKHVLGRMIRKKTATLHFMTASRILGQCGRYASQLSANGYCEGCVMQAAIDAQERT